MKSSESNSKIRVGILDDHQSTLDGYSYRLGLHKNIEVAATARYGDELEPMLAKHPLDVLILDIGVPANTDSESPYPILYLLPRLREKYPKTAILIISMHKVRTMVQALMQAGARGYILKDDGKASEKLGEIVTSIAAGGVYFSEESFAALVENPTPGSDVQLLTQRQREVLSLCAAKPGLTTELIAKDLNIAGSTLRNLLSDSYKRLKVRNLTAAIIRARELGLITPLPPIS